FARCMECGSGWPVTLGKKGSMSCPECGEKAAWERELIRLTDRRVGVRLPHEERLRRNAESRRKKYWEEKAEEKEGEMARWFEITNCRYVNLDVAGFLKVSSCRDRFNVWAHRGKDYLVGTFPTESAAHAFIARVLGHSLDRQASMLASERASKKAARQAAK